MATHEGRRADSENDPGPHTRDQLVLERCIAMGLRWHSCIVDKDTYYDILGVPASSSPDLIRSNYRLLIRKVHPDLGGPIALFRQVQESYEVLSDPARRARYDRSLEARNRAGSDDPPDQPSPGHGSSSEPSASFEFESFAVRHGAVTPACVSRSRPR